MVSDLCLRILREENEKITKLTINNPSQTFEYRFSSIALLRTDLIYKEIPPATA